MDYQHATTEHHRQFLTGRLAALEVEHHGLVLLIDGAAEGDPQLAGWVTMRDATERNILALRKGLTQLDGPAETAEQGTTPGRARRSR